MSAHFLLLVAVAGVGVLHTVVPDHWLPIALIARQEGWTRPDTAWAAFGAGRPPGPRRRDRSCRVDCVSIRGETIGRVRPVIPA